MVGDGAPRGAYHRRGYAFCAASGVAGWQQPAGIRDYLLRGSDSSASLALSRERVRLRLRAVGADRVALARPDGPPRSLCCDTPSAVVSSSATVPTPQPASGPRRSGSAAGPPRWGLHFADAGRMPREENVRLGRAEFRVPRGMIPAAASPAGDSAARSSAPPGCRHSWSARVSCSSASGSPHFPRARYGAAAQVLGLSYSGRTRGSGGRGGMTSRLFLGRVVD